MESSKLYSISEIFTSVQGEGQFAGAMMTFIRLAGCSVGKPFPKERYESKTVMVSHHDHDDEPETIPGLPIYTEMCTLYDGRTFECDTDYRVKYRLPIKHIMKQVPEHVEHICITGGEPFIHKLDDFYNYAPKEVLLHVETSGTKPLREAFPNTPRHKIWVTVSPKFGVLPAMIHEANEIKLLVDENFDEEKLPVTTFNHPLVYIQPVNYEFKVNVENLKRVMELQKKHPKWRVSLQLHKVLENYIQERIR